MLQVLGKFTKPTIERYKKNIYYIFIEKLKLLILP
jgi:hypothetical protein